MTNMHSPKVMTTPAMKMTVLTSNTGPQCGQSTVVPEAKAANTAATSAVAVIRFCAFLSRTVFASSWNLNSRWTSS